MKSKNTLKQILLVMMLLGAGLVSPSNGVDDQIHKQPLQMLFEAGMIILIVLSIYFLYHLIGLRRYSHM